MDIRTAIIPVIAFYTKFSIFLLGVTVKCVIVYWSRYGNGLKVVNYLAAKLKGKGSEVKVFKTEEANPEAMPKADMYVFSAPAEVFNVQKNMRNFMKKLKGMEGRKYGIINTHSMKRNWLGKMEKLLSKKKMEKVAAVGFQVGDGVEKGQGLRSNWEKDLDAFVERVQSSK